MTAWDEAGFDIFCKSHGENPEDDLIRTIKASLFEYEKELYRKWGYRQRATYTWRGIEKYGAIGSMKRRVLSPRTSAGFKLLIAAGRPEETDECFVLRYLNRICDAGPMRDELARVAKRRLLRAGVNLSRCLIETQERK